MSGDIWGLVLSYVFVFGIIGLGEIARKLLGLKEEFTRKFIHIGVGHWIFLAIAFFGSWKWAIIPPATFILLNYLSYRATLFKSMEIGEKSNLGTIYYPVSLLVLVAVFFSLDSRYIAAVGIMAMAWGDGMAAIIGLHFGRLSFFVGDRKKSLEGSCAMFSFSFISIFVALLLLSPYSGFTLILKTLVTSLLATFLELVSIRGTDNLSVPILTSMIFYLLLR